MKIYNKWGETVFESFDENNCWDGIHHNALFGSGPAQEGFYYYQLVVKDEPSKQFHRYNGQLMLMRNGN